MYKENDSNISEAVDAENIAAMNDSDISGNVETLAVSESEAEARMPDKPALTRKRQQKKLTLPTDVTEQARCSEAMDLSLIDSENVFKKTYLKVSDDRGEFINIKPLYRKIKERFRHSVADAPAKSSSLFI